jgi:signal transduction histidine kinase
MQANQESGHAESAPQSAGQSHASPSSHPSEPSQLNETELRLQEQFDYLEAQFARLKDQARQAQRLASLGTAATVLAHEFNNLMSPVVGYAQFAIDSQDPELMAKALRITLKQTAIMTAMSDRILGLAANETSSVQRVNIKEAIDDARECLIRDLSKDNIEFITEIDDSLTFQADPRQMQQVFFNLLTNARQAIQHRHGRITIAAKRTDDETVSISFRDNGSGIPKDSLDAIFGEFYSTKKDRPGKSGIGLGLSLCRDIVEEHRGTIQVASEVGKGTIFTLKLPSGN